jgi:hypothetical protein
MAVRNDTQPPPGLGYSFQSNRFPDGVGSALIAIYSGEEELTETEITRPVGERWRVEIYDRGVCTNVRHVVLRLPARVVGSVGFIRIEEPAASRITRLDDRHHHLMSVPLRRPVGAMAGAFGRESLRHSRGRSGPNHAHVR